MPQDEDLRYCNGAQHHDRVCPGHEQEQECTCTVVDPKYWTTHYGAVEPGSMYEWNPECPVHT